MRGHRPRVVDVAGTLQHEQGPHFDAGRDRLAVVAHWSDRPLLSRSVQTLLRELTTAGYGTALVSSATCAQPLEFSVPGLADEVSVYRRPNVGYDFGSWASFLHAFPDLVASPRVILANDSLVGPFETIAPVLRSFDRCPADIWGITGTTQDAAHLQSHFIGYRDGVLAEPILRRFWRDIRVERDKRQLILRYEIGMGRLAFAEGYVLAAHYPWDWVTALGQTPTSAGWRRLILRGFPFVKRELLLRPPPEVPDAGDIPRVVRERWGENVQEWL